MESNHKEAGRWLRQAESELKASEWNIQGGFHAVGCFLAQQSATKSLRSFIFLHNEDSREARSVTDLLERAITYEEDFKPLIDKCSRLDLYYKSARYPDVLPGAIPAEIFTERDSKEALSMASEILTLVEEKRKGFLPDAF